MAARAKPCILVIDDDPNVVQLVKMNLEFEGYEVETAYNGLKGLDMARRVRPDLILLDIMMPNLDGWDVVNEIRRTPELKGVPVVMLTALNQPEAVATSLTFGADVHLPKPFEPDAMLEIVRRLLGDKASDVPSEAEED